MDIPRGTPILSETELFSIIERRNFKVPQAQANRPEFQALSCPIDPATAEARFAANAFSMGKSKGKGRGKGRGKGARGGEKQGIFPNASRFNHSCVPNAFFSWNEKSKALTIHAIIDIPSGQEIFLNYYSGDFLDTTIERQQELSNSYNFECACSACHSATDLGMASEARRDLMRVYDDIIERNRDADVLDDRKQLLAIIQAFGRVLQEEVLLYPQLADNYDEEILWYRREVDRSSNGAESVMTGVELRGAALQVARTKLDLDVVCTGYNSPEVKKTLETIREFRQK